MKLPTVLGVVGLAVVPAAASAKTYRCADLKTKAYGDVVVSNIHPLSPDGLKTEPSTGACYVAIDVVSQAMVQLDIDHVANPHKPYPTSLRLRLDGPGDVNAIEIWRYKIRYVKASILHGHAVATCARQRITWTIGPNPPNVIGSYKSP